MPLASAVTLGASVDADWVLGGPSPAVGSVLVEPFGEFVRLEPLDGAVVTRKGRRLSRPRLVRPPCRFRFGDLEFHVAIVEGGAWVPSDAVHSDPPTGGSFEDVRLRTGRLRLDGDALRAGGRSKPVAGGGPAPQPKRLGIAALLVAAGAIGLAGGAAAFIAPRPVPASAPARPALHGMLNGEPLVSVPKASAIATTVRVPGVRDEPGVGAIEPVPSASAGSTAELRRLKVDTDALLRRAGFGPEVSVAVDRGVVFVDGRLDTDELRRLAGVLRRAAQADARFGDVEARTEQTDGTVPFKVEQVVAGARPFVVLSDGTKLHIGSSHQGYRLVEVSATKVIMQGPRRLELDW